MDGYGIREEEHGNAIKASNTPNIDHLMKQYPHILLDASGEQVGLPHGQMGNSEVGHMNIGAGRIVYQSLTLINKEIKEGTFYTNEKLLATINHVKKNNSTLNLFILFSDGGVHSHMEHMFAMMELAKKENVENVKTNIDKAVSKVNELETIQANYAKEFYESPYAYLFGELTESFNDASYYGYPAKGKLVIAASDDPAHHLKMTFFSGKAAAVTTYADVSAGGSKITTVQTNCMLGTFYSSTLDVYAGGGSVAVWGTLKFDYPTIADYAASK
jgi:hypothetical protein